MEKDIAARISLVTPRSFDPSKPRELQVKLEKKWEVIGNYFAVEKVDPKNFAIEKVNPTAPAAVASAKAASGTTSGSRKVVKLVCMSDTHSTQGEFG